MKRRNVVLALLTLSTSPLTVHAQRQERTARIGFLAPLSRSTSTHPDPFYDAFVQGMRDLGYIEGKNLVIEWRFADGQFERLGGLATELAQLNLDVIVTHSTPATRALRRATRSIPIVFAVLVDPVGNGFAKSLARPEGNITGLSVIDIDPSPKRLELLKALSGRLSRVAVLLNPRASAQPAIVKDLEAAGQRIGVEVVPMNAHTSEEIAQTFAAMVHEHIDGAIIGDDAFFRGHRQQIALLGAKSRIPVIAPWREYVAAGGLISYGQDIAESFRRAATYVDKILKGAKPGTLPIEQPTKLHLAINSKTAMALGLTLPSDLLLRADEVFE